MTFDQIIAAVDGSFGQLSRPERFIRGTCSCDECREHEATMQSLVLPDLPLEKLNHPSWDPMCFASTEAFLYLMPGLVRLALSHTNEYIDQFLFHLETPGRTDALSGHQRRALGQVLDYLIRNEAGVLENAMVVDNVFRVRDNLEQK